MIDPAIKTLLEDYSKSNYLSYMDNLDNIYDVEFIRSLYDIVRLQRDSLNMMIELLMNRHDYLSKLTYTIKIYIEKYYWDNDKVDYYVFQQITPNIDEGEKLTFVKPGQRFDDDKLALEFAESLQKTYGGEIVRTVV